MKKILIFTLILTGLVSCNNKKTELNTDFAVPNEINSPESVQLVAGSTDKVVFSWKGGGADDGMYVLYELLIDKKGGDFSNPLHRQTNDLGGVQRASITHYQLNSLAKAAGARPGETATLIWTVKTSKGGESKLFTPAKEFKVTRYDGLETPEILYLYGTATEKSGAGGRIFGEREDGVFVIYTKLTDGNIYFTDGTGSEATKIYFDSKSNKYKEGDETVTVASTGEAATRIIVSFKESKLSFGEVKEMQAIWRHTDQPFGSIVENGWTVYAPFSYLGEGKFLMPGLTANFKHGDPSWGHGGLAEDGRYYFKVKVGETFYHWRNWDQVEAPTSTTPLSYFLINDEPTWEPWREVYWSLSEVYRDKKTDFTIFAGEDGRLYHSTKISEQQ